MSSLNYPFLPEPKCVLITELKYFKVLWSKIKHLEDKWSGATAAPLRIDRHRYAPSRLQVKTHTETCLADRTRVVALPLHAPPRGAREISPQARPSRHQQRLGERVQGPAISCGSVPQTARAPSGPRRTPFSEANSVARGNASVSQTRQGVADLLFTSLVCFID